MAQLIPGNFDSSSLPESERRVVAHLLDGLDESWIVVPSVPITYNGKDREIDIVLIGFDKGAYVIEVKGGIVTVDDGQWKSYEKSIKNPARQASSAKYALIKRLGKSPASQVHLAHLVALPDNADFPHDGAGPDCPRDIVLTKHDLSDIARTIERIGHPRPVNNDQVQSLLKALRPDITQIQVDGRHVRGMLNRMADATGERLGPVIGLDENKRVYLRGSAGTGKTFVALRWYRRALIRGESVLYVCFNSPLAGEIETRVANITDRLIEDGRVLPDNMVANFHALMRRMMGESAPEIPAGDEIAIQNYWNSDLPSAFKAFLPTISSRFDTIIIDEAQDFRPAWLEILEGLMVDRNDSRLYLMADSDQAIYTESWMPPSGVTTLELTHNIRNSANIGTVVKRLGGAPVPRSVPGGPEVSFHEVRGSKEAVKAVRKSLETAAAELGIPPSQTAILVAHRAERDLLNQALTGDTGLVLWQDRTEEAIICETVHRTKGLERQAVVLVMLDDDPDDTIAYIGASRASAYLSIVAKKPLIDRAKGL